MKNRIFKFFRAQWLLIWILVVSAGLLSNIVFAEYGTQSSYMKRVVVSTSDQSMMFSSNYLTEGGNNVYQAKYVTKPDVPDTDFSADVNVYIWNFSTRNSAQTYPENIEYTMEYKVTDPSGAAVSDMGTRTITITKPDGTTVEVSNSNLSGSFDYTYVKTDADNKYTLTYNGWNPDTDSGICLQLIAKPKKTSGKYSDLRDIGGIIGLKTETGSSGGGWEAYVSEIRASIDRGEADGYNLVVTGSGKAEVIIRWDPEKIDMNKYFKESPVITYSEVGTPEDDDLKAGWKKMTISADAGERNRYNIQLYLKQGRPDNYDFFKQRSEALDNTWVTYEINNITNEG